MKNLTVVIPYFQRQLGVLAKAVQSALDQEGVGRLEIIVVDDGSPVPARSELAALTLGSQVTLHIVEQANAGPAAARNTGLAHVSRDTEYVAFLDSDDEWTPQHLANALCALEQGFDFYFADHYQLNQTVGAFDRAKRIRVADHPCIGGVDHLHAYRGDMFNQILTGNVVGTSTVVYRYARYPSLRFREEFVYAGEDYLFWLELSKLTDRVAFSALCECRYGKGVNVFAGSGWGTEKSLRRLHYETKYKKAVARLFTLTPAQQQANLAAVRGLRKSFVADVMHRLKHRKGMDQVLLPQLRVDPLSFVYFVPLALQLTVGQKLGRLRARQA
jgi:succinoglycan biosynthesis protein ExoW